MRIRSTSGDLRNLFEQSINVQHLAESLVTVPASSTGSLALKMMTEAGFDVLGIEEGGFVSGYVQKATINDGPCWEQTETFHPSELVADSTPLIDVLPLLLKHPRLFVLRGHRVEEIVTRADLEKAPVQMLTYGLISLLEMNLLRLIRQYYPGDIWRPLLTDQRIEKAEELFARRRRRNEEIDLSDCLQLADKRTIVLKTKELVELLRLESTTSGQEFLKRVERLRDRLAHAQELSKGSSWSEIITLIYEIERLVARCEGVPTRG